MTDQEKKLPTEETRPVPRWGDGSLWGEGLTFGPSAPPAEQPKPEGDA